MAIRNARRPDSEWLAIITEARQSGLTDEQWCLEHNISKHSFYTAVSRLRKKAWDVPDPQRNNIYDMTSQKQEVVQIGITDIAEKSDIITGNHNPGCGDTAIEIVLSGCTIKISNAASPSIVSALMSSVRDVL